VGGKLSRGNNSPTAKDLSATPEGKNKGYLVSGKKEKALKEHEHCLNMKGVK
jgi:hypothetical protein